MATTVNVKVNNAWTNIGQILFPVNSVILTTSSTSPAAALGGTWTQLTGGLLGAAGSGTGYAGGGATAGSTTISAGQLPAHKHTIGVYSDGAQTHESPLTSFAAITQNQKQGISEAKMWTNASATKGAWYAPYWYLPVSGDTCDMWTARATNSTGSGSAFIPKHLGLYVWKRTA